MPGQVRRSLQGRDRRDRLREPPHPVPACLSLDPGVELRVLSKGLRTPTPGAFGLGPSATQLEKRFGDQLL